MPKRPPTYSAYPGKFRCIGSACEDTCCQGWKVPIDRITYKKYRSLPESPLSRLISESIAECGEHAREGMVSNAVDFAQIRMDGANRCGLLMSEGLCRIHAELGEEMLGYTCSTYPRIVHEYGDLRETALALSCPEAARVVLLSPELADAELPAGTELRGRQQVDRDAAITAPGDGSARHLPPNFNEIRKAMLALVSTRTYPLWQRLFLLGLMCRRLDSIARGELKRSVPEFVADFEAVVAAGSLRPAMETLPVDRSAQLDVVLRLAGLMLHRSNVTARFAECARAFAEGIGNGPGATLESLTAQYTRAHDFWYEPFFRHHPHILENYLINTIIRCQFPFGREGMEPGSVAQMAVEFARLTAQFALIRGLLIGVAGFHGAAFSTAHVVSTVQSAAKHFEHHPEFQKLAYELLLESQMEGARGMAILLRNVGPETAEAGLAHGPRPGLSAAGAGAGMPA